MRSVDHAPGVGLLGFGAMLLQGEGSNLNPKKVVKENCAFMQCDGCTGTTMRTITKNSSGSGKSMILNPSVRIEPVRTDSRGPRIVPARVRLLAAHLGRSDPPARTVMRGP